MHEVENPLGLTNCWGLWVDSFSSVVKHSLLGPLLLYFAVCISCTGLSLYFTLAQLRIFVCLFVFMDFYIFRSFPTHVCQKSGPFHSDSEIGNGLYWILTAGCKGRYLPFDEDAAHQNSLGIILQFNFLTLWGRPEKLCGWLWNLLWFTEKKQ